MNKYGFIDTESILNEWNPGTQRRGTEEDACFISEMICSLHRTPLDMLMYYDGQVNGSYQGLFNPLKKEIFPAYFALHSFNELYELKNEVYSLSADGLPVLAASDGEIGKILIPNTSFDSVDINLKLSEGWNIERYRVLEGTVGIMPCDVPEIINIPAN